MSSKRGKHFKFTFKIKNITILKIIALSQFHFSLEYSKPLGEKEMFSLSAPQKYLILTCIRIYLFSHTYILIYVGIKYFSFCLGLDLWSDSHECLELNLHFYNWVRIMSTWAGKVLSTSPKSKTSNLLNISRFLSSTIKINSTKHS